MRGCSVGGISVGASQGVFPAYAGMFLSIAPLGSGCAGFPRVCGDVPNTRQKAIDLDAFSPRMRGCSAREEGRIDALDVFPAYAGMLRTLGGSAWIKRCFPRVCGDVPSLSGTGQMHSTFSPRMRGCS